MYFEWILSQIVSTIKQRLIWLHLFWLLWTSALMSSLWCHFYPGEQSGPYESPIWVCPLKSSIQTYRQAWMAHKPQVCSLSLISLWLHWYWYWLYWYWHWLYWAHCRLTSPDKNFIQQITTSPFWHWKTWSTCHHHQMHWAWIRSSYWDGHTFRCLDLSQTCWRMPWKLFSSFPFLRPWCRR